MTSEEGIKSLKLELQMFGATMWVLEIEPTSSARKERAFKHWAISSAPIIYTVLQIGSHIVVKVDEVPGSGLELLTILLPPW